MNKTNNKMSKQFELHNNPDDNQAIRIEKEFWEDASADLLVQIRNQFNNHLIQTSKQQANKHPCNQCSNSSKTKSTESKSRTTNNSFINDKQHDCNDNESGLKEREKKFSVFLNKFGVKRDKKQFENNSRIELLYEHAKIQTAFKDKLRSEIRSKAYQKEKSQCTFNPKINQKSLSMTKREKETPSIYQRGIMWSNLKIEKIKHEKRIKFIEESDYSFRPNIEPINCKKKVSNDRKNMFQDLSIVSFFERQETARKARTSREEKIAPRNYSAHRIEKPRKTSSRFISRVMLNKYKEVLHKELAHSMIDDDTDKQH